ncbi:hypothetical protein N1F78_10390 [Seonamhaeicola sp. MEBiC1930]|uniref:Spy/CpxP family protein refolding chaperone n=1 Tax=Seonamhaeicola sp. MEBiC01930 TaxID=2976768 RepID=UPI003243317E
MKKNLLLYILLIFLIVVNGFFLFNYLGKSSSASTQMPKGKGPISFIVNALEFSDEQMDKLEIINEEHHMSMRGITRRELVLKEELHELISKEEVSDDEVDFLFKDLGNTLIDHEKKMFYHLRRIRMLCNEGQKLKFDQIIKEAKRGRRPGPGMGERPQDRRNGPPPRGEDGGGPPPTRGEDFGGPPPTRP